MKGKFGEGGGGGGSGGGNHFVIQSKSLSTEARLFRSRVLQNGKDKGKDERKDSLIEK